MSEPLDSRVLRQALGSFLTGVTVVTTIDADGAPRGFTANSFTSVSLDPPLILVCIGKKSRSLPSFAEGTGFAVNILSELQQPVARIFATPTPDRFSGLNWQTGPAGNPILPDSCAWLDCRRHQYIDAGDHLIMIGLVAGFSDSTHPPLGYCRGAYVSAGLERSASMRPDFSTEVLAILENTQGLLLAKTSEGTLSLPRAAYIGTYDDSVSLIGRLWQSGIKAELGFVFSVIEDLEARLLRIIYRGTAEPVGDGDGTLLSFELGQIPWDRLDQAATRIVLRRYVQERSQYRFGVYVGGSETGQIAELASGTKPSSNNDINSFAYDP